MSSSTLTTTLTRHSHRPTRAIIDPDALAYNIRHLQKNLGPGTDLMAVVKGNGYGHGAGIIARAALAAGARWIGVATVDEGISLRSSGIEAPILVHAPSAPEEFPEALAANLRLGIGTLTAAQALSEIARGLERPATIHVEIDTGMHRFGFPSGMAVDAVQELYTNRALNVEGIYTHLVAGEDADGEISRYQLALFEKVVADLKGRGIEIPIVHAANSGGVLHHHGTHLPLVRTGIALYGYHPSGIPASESGLRQVLSLISTILRLEDVPAETGVSYNHTAHTTRPSRLGLVPIGYADGLSRAQSNKGHMLVNGQRCPIIGRVCMDQTVIDVTNVPDVYEGSSVVIIGEQNGERIGADDIAALTGTIPYEVLTSISTRVPRIVEKSPHDSNALENV